MAAPSGIVWGSEVGGYGRIGIYKNITNTNTTTTAKIEIWFWSKYSVSDTGNTFYFDNLASSGSATTNRGALSIKTTVASGAGWSTSNQKLLKSYSYSYTRGTSATTRYLYAKLTDIDRVGGTMYASTTFSVPKLASYTVSYNANGGSGAPSNQTKWYGKSLTLSGTKPTRIGYSFSKWNTNTSGTGTSYAPGTSYTGNAALKLYAIWTANTYKITYNANGGSGAPTAQTKTYGKTLTLSSTKPTRANYKFLGWSTNKSATTAAYSAGGSFTTNAATTLYAVWELAYVKPKINSFSVRRCTEDRASSDTGTYALVNLSWVTFSEAPTIVVSWESASSGSGSETLTASSTEGGVDVLIGDGSLSTEATYTVRVTVSDSGGSVSLSKTLSGSVYPIDVLAKGKGIAFGKPAELSGYMDVGYNAQFNKPIRMVNNQPIYGFDPNGNVKSSFIPQNENGNTVVGYGNFRADPTDTEHPLGNTNVYGHDVNIGVSNIANPGTFRPYRRQGDSITLSIRTAGYVTNAKKDISFWVPVSVPIVGAPKVSVTSGNGFVLRQGDSYTHGSTAETYVTPTSYEAATSMFGGVYIKAVFSNTTNAINNDTIGIYWNGTITFS